MSALVAASVSAYSPEFGCETGILLGDETKLKNYSCPMPTMDPTAKMWLDMLTSLTAMASGMN